MRTTRAAGTNPLTSPAPSPAAALHYQAAVDLYKGRYLPELDDTWVVTERERLFLLYLDAVLKLAALALEEKNYEAALARCQQVLKEDACHEEAHRMAMRVHAAQGNRALVVRQWEQCTQALLEELDAAPSQQTEDLYELLIE